ncbi:hypothetical protein GOV09_02530 [Candidatus Woesearchaeota archaeon]|nr:hypothetical protein [Candidatus Woesearchaeota archaeon]
MRIRKKGQIQMMETIVVLFIFFIIVILGLVFYTRIAKSSLAEKLDQYEELSKIQVAQIASSLPELQCSQDNIVKSNCVDLLKVEAATTVMSNNAADYFDLFAFSRITIYYIYPRTGNWPDEWEIYNVQPDDWDSKLPSYFPISLFDPFTQNYYFGVMVVEVYK